MKIICIGRNYLPHIKELGGRIPEEPMFFLKPDTALLRNNSPFYIPDFSNEIHYETELVVRITKAGRSVAEKYTRRYYDSVTLGIDFTARDLQRKAVENGDPWEKCKGFDYSAAVAPRWMPLEELGADIGRLSFSMTLNGEIRQKGFTGDMLFSVDRIISYVSQFMTLRMGDLIFTGTPEGVGPVRRGDRIEAQLEGHKLLDFEIR